MRTTMAHALVLSCAFVLATACTGFAGTVGVQHTYLRTRGDSHAARDEHRALLIVGASPRPASMVPSAGSDAPVPRTRRRTLPGACRSGFLCVWERAAVAHTLSQLEVAP